MYQPQQQTVVPAVGPAQWEIYALLPAMIVIMVLAMAFKLIGRVTEPEFVREVRPIAERAAIARAGGRKLLPGGR